MNVGRLLWIGGACLIGGWALAFFTVLDLFKPSLSLGFLAFALVLIGTITGFYGLYISFRSNRTRP